jgi:hypothetical protein
LRQRQTTAILLRIGGPPSAGEQAALNLDAWWSDANIRIDTLRMLNLRDTLQLYDFQLNI